MEHPPRPAWIDTVSETEAEGFLKAECYERIAPGGGPIANIYKALSLRPRLLRRRLDFSREVLHRPSALTRRQKEMVAVVTSALVGCHY